MADHRTRVTKMLIRKAFTELLRQKPIQKVSIKELCAAAGIHRGTFYTHYTDIYDLLQKMEEEMLDDLKQALQPLLDPNAKEPTLFEITSRIFQCLKENADLCTVTLGPYGDKEFATRLIQIGQERYVEGYRKLFPQATPKQLEYYYAFVSAGCIGLLEKWLMEGMVTSAEEIAATAEAIMMYGIGSLDKSF